jgi:hypothetical protein
MRSQRGLRSDCSDRRAKDIDVSQIHGTAKNPCRDNAAGGVGLGRGGKNPRYTTLTLTLT